MMKEVLLSAICDLKNGFAFKSKDYVDISNTLSCRMSSIRPGGNFDLEHNQRFLPDNYAKLYSDYLLSDGDIVIAMTDLAGDPKILGVPTIVKTGGKNLLQNQRVGKLVVSDNSKVFIPFLQYALNRPINKSYYKKFAGGGLQINVSKKDILNNTVPLPPLSDQKKIAAILDAADAYRQKTKALIEKYDELTQSLFLDMFGDPVTNPMGWEIFKGEDLCFNISVGVVVKPASHYVDSGVLALRSLNVKPYRFDLKDVVYFSVNAHKTQLKKSILKAGDVVVVRTGNTGTAAIIPNDMDGINCIDLIIVRVDRSKLSPNYLCHFLNSERGKKLVLGKSVGGIQKHFNVGAMKKTDIPLPSIDLQTQFAERVQAIESQKAQAQASLKQAEDLFNSLLQRAFKGELTK